MSKFIRLFSVSIILVGCAQNQQLTPEEMQVWRWQQLQQLNENSIRQMEGAAKRTKQWEKDILQRQRERVEQYRRLNLP